MDKDFGCRWWAPNFLRLCHPFCLLKKSCLFCRPFCLPKKSGLFYPLKSCLFYRPFCLLKKSGLFYPLKSCFLKKSCLFCLLKKSYYAFAIAGPGTQVDGTSVCALQHSYNSPELATVQYWAGCGNCPRSLRMCWERSYRK